MSFDPRAARLNMVESQVRTADVTDYGVTDAMRAVEREALCPADKAVLAYADAEIEYVPGLWLMRPREIGKLLQTLLPRAGERALCIAAPYAAAVLREMGLEVAVVEGADLAKIPKGPFDVILTEGSVAEVPVAWIAALAEGGRLGVVVRRGPVGKARLYLCEGGRTGWRETFDATPPYLPGLQPKAQFAF